MCFSRGSCRHMCLRVFSGCSSLCLAVPWCLVPSNRTPQLSLLVAQGYPLLYSPAFPNHNNSNYYYDYGKRGGRGEGKEGRSEHILLVCCVISSMAKTWRSFSSVTLTRTVDQSSHYPHFIGKGAEAQRASFSCLFLFWWICVLSAAGLSSSATVLMLPFSSNQLQKFPDEYTIKTKHMRLKFSPPILVLGFLALVRI